VTDGFLVPGPTATGPLAASVARVAELAIKLGLSHGDVFDVHQLSDASGVPADVVGDLLDGRPAGEPDLQARFLQRFDLLRRTRLKPNGRRYTQQEIADGAGMSRQQAGALINGDRRPTMEHCAAIQRFFKVHAGFLTAEDTDALAGALQRVEEQLRQRQSRRRPDGTAPPAAAGADAGGGYGSDGYGSDGPDDPLERLLQDHGVRGIAWRAAQLPTDKHRDTVTEWLDMLLENVRRAES
jgi:transcriptional regulator with XRE-family HTH domain